jgi:hypothetical protein
MHILRGMLILGYILRYYFSAPLQAVESITPNPLSNLIAVCFRYIEIAFQPFLVSN